ncbi:MAG: hypothetical protein PHI66_00265 [Candidatus Pacebacteria bacterium]|nr:hypothetical protein [Candidatus Paceibacterota bacterium]
MKNKKIIGITAFSILMGSAIFSANASSSRFSGMREKCNLSEETRQSIDAAIQNGDYDKWKSLVESVGGDRISGATDKDTFAVIIEAYKLKESGDLEGAISLLEENGVQKKMFFSRGDMVQSKDCGDCLRDDGQRGDMMEVFESGDYETWKVLMEQRGGGKILEIINEENFSKFAEAKILQSEGKNDEAKTILDELDFPFQERRAREFSGVRRGK